MLSLAPEKSGQKENRAARPGSQERRLDVVPFQRRVPTLKRRPEPNPVQPLFLRQPNRRTKNRGEGMHARGQLLNRIIGSL
jgi:hypothetical protein